MLERVISGAQMTKGPRHDGESSWRPVQLTEISPPLAEALSLLRMRRSPPELRLAGRAMRIATAWAPDAPDIASPWCAAVEIDGRTAQLILPHALLDLIFRNADPSLAASALRPEHAALLLEFALSDALGAIETALGCSIALMSVAEGTGGRENAPDAFLPVALQLQGAGTFWCQLRLEAPYLLALARYLDKISAAPPRRMHLPLPVRLRWAMAELTLSELRGLSPGDIILVDHACRDRGTAIAVFGEHLAAPVELSPLGYRLAGRARLTRGSGWEWALDRGPFNGRSEDEGTPGDVPVRLFFELGQFQADCAALPQPGAMVPLARPLEEGVDIIIGGAPIGRGQITTIGDATGIQVTRL
jgi:flagellar motor switch/type III secretory pathway protein FliN